MKSEIQQDIFTWDSYNWSRSIKYWESQIDLNKYIFDCLELGSGQGGMSLWLAQKGHKVICSDCQEPSQRALPIHQKYDVVPLISYSAIDALNIPYEDRFDIVILKSVLGGIGDNEKVKIAINQIYKSLKPGGHFIFVENLKASYFHMFVRRLFINWANIWNYIDYKFLSQTLEIFDEVNLKRFGVFGVFGRNESQKAFLGKLDKYFFEKVLPNRFYYIVAGVVRKPNF